MTMNIRLALALLWLIVGAILLYFGASDTLRWGSDPEAIRMGFDWTYSYLPHGIAAMLTAIGLFFGNRAGLWVAIGGAAVFGLYYFAYLVFGGEGSLVLRLAVPALFLVLVAATLRYAWHTLRSSNPGQSRTMS